MLSKRSSKRGLPLQLASPTVSPDNLLLKFSEGRIVGWLIDETRHVVCGLGADRSLRRSRQRSTRLVCNSSLCCPGALGTGHKSSSKLHHRSRQAGKAAFFIPSLTHASTFAMRHQSTRSRGCSADVVSYGVLHMLAALHFVGSESAMAFPCDTGPNTGSAHSLTEHMVR